MSRVFSLKEPSSRDYPQIFAPIWSETISPTRSLSLLRQMKYTRVGFHLLRFTQSPALRRRNPLSTPLDLQFLTVLGALLLLTPAAVSPVVLSLLPCAIIIEHGGQGQRNAELRVPGRKTSSPAGGPSYTSCRAFYFNTFGLFTRFTQLMKIPDRFWCISISVPCSSFFFHLVWSQIAYSRWFLAHLLWFSDYTSSIWRPQVWMALPTRSGSCSHPGRGFFEAFQPVIRRGKPEGFQLRSTNLPVHRPSNCSRLHFSSVPGKSSLHSEVYPGSTCRISRCSFIRWFHSL